MDRIYDDKFILDQLQHLSLEEFDKLINTITKEEL